MEARIKGVVVLVVARFVIFMVDGKISPLNTVTAHSDRTGVCAGILIIVVPIIASFDSGLQMTITARCRSTIGQTRISLDLIGVITSLDASLDMTVTASCCRTII